MRKPAASRALAGPLSANEALLVGAVLAALASSGAGQQQFEELGKRGLPASSALTHAMAGGDFDGDGDLDLVLGSGGSFPWAPHRGQSRLYLNDGTGIFADATAARMPTAGADTRDIAVGDVDGDGDLDLVLGNTLEDFLYLNDGTGAFIDATAAQLPPGIVTSTLSVALGDVDGDADLDLVEGTRGDQTRLYVNDGRGTFTETTAGSMPAAEDETRAVALGDVDGDGDLDLALGNATSRYVSAATGQDRLYLNDGTGRFSDATAARMPVTMDSTTSAAFGDVDGDGDVDLFFGNALGTTPSAERQDRLYLNDGTGTFSDATTARFPVENDDASDVVLGDVDLDGDLDLLCGNFGHPQANRLYLNDGTGSFSEAAAAVPGDNHRTFKMVLGDVDGDGDPDLAFISDFRSSLFLNDGDGAFADATAGNLPVRFWNMLAIGLGDVDRDGDLDLFGGENGDCFLYVNDGTGVFDDVSAARLPVNADETAAVALGDVDGDGDLDVVIGNGGSVSILGTSGLGEQNRLYLNDGTGTFIDATADRLPVDDDNTRAVVLADVDGDGDLDLVSGNYYSERQNKLYLNDGKGTFVDATATHLPVDDDYTLAAAAGDVDGDGDVDLVFGNGGAFNRQDRLYLNDGTGRFTDVTAIRMPRDSYHTTCVALGDFDRDGDLDLVLGSSPSP